MPPAGVASERGARRLVFLTGATGLIGRHLLVRLAADPALRVRCLSRRPLAAIGAIEPIPGDLRDPAAYRDALRGAGLVVHLAAATHKARRSTYFDVNVAGTRALVEACRSAGVERLIFFSSIAATYPDTRVYYYAQSKQQAEAIVRDSGLNYLIVRPTVVFAPDAPIWHRFLALAGLPVVPLPGSGAARLQPIAMDDLVAWLASIVADERPLPNRPIDLGGPDVVSMEDLVRRIARVRGRHPPFVHLPARLIIRVLAWLEPWAFSLLPITAGQLSAFVNDSVAAGDLALAERVPEPQTLDQIIRALASN